MAEIEKCPFCRGKAVLQKGTSFSTKDSFRVICEKCYSTSGWYNTEDEAVESWNHRVPASFPVNSSSENLSSCPFCGGSAHIRGEKYWQPRVARNAICNDCHASSGWFDTDEEATDAWNSRND